MTEKLDLKDKKILYELDVDGFQTNSSIAKKVRLSKQVVGYRINQLEQEGIIRKVYAVINLERLGYYGQKVYFQMQNIDETAEKMLISYFSRHDKVVWFGIYEGRFDFVVSIFEKNIVEFDKTLSGMLTHLKEYVVDFEIASYTGVLALKKKYLEQKRTTEKFSYFSGYANPINLDTIDIHIIRTLCNDARTSSTFIAQKTGLSADAIIMRTKRLKRQEIIQGSRLMLNKNLLGIHEFKLLLKLKNFDEQTHKKFIEFSKMNPFIVAYIRTVGMWNIELDIEMPNLSDMHRLVMQLKTMFSDAIRSIETIMLHDEYKYDFYPF